MTRAITKLVEYMEAHDNCPPSMALDAAKCQDTYDHRAQSRLIWESYQLNDVTGAIRLLKMLEGCGDHHGRWLWESETDFETLVRITRHNQNAKDANTYTGINASFARALIIAALKASVPTIQDGSA